jgi:hypothetical protein
MSKENSNSSGMELGVVLFLIFMVLKLTNTIDWSWWWVTSPLWIPLALAAAVLAIVGLIAFIIYLID